MLGDAIKVGYLANINNSGIITAVSANGIGGAFAIEIGGGTIVNNAGGVIKTAGATAISVGDAGTTDAVGAVNIDNGGAITGNIVLNSAQNNIFTNRGPASVFPGASVGGSVSLGAGDDTANLYVGSSISGLLDGGLGNNTLTLNGTPVTSQTLGQTANFQTLEVLGADWTLAGPQTTWANSASVANGGSLILATTFNTPTVTLNYGSQFIVKSGVTATLANGIVWDMAPPVTGIVQIDNKGTITAGGRGIDTSGSNTEDTLILTNETGALLTAVSDGFRINGDIGTGVITVNNSGTIQSTGTGRALSFNGITSAKATVKINNLAGGVIQAAGDDAIGPGTGNITIVNDGTIQSTAATGRAINLNTTDLSSLRSFSLTNASGATIQSPGDALRITAGTLQANSTYAVAVDNTGAIKSTGTGANNGQAIDFNDLIAATGSVTITNHAGGVIQAADADAIRPGNNSTIDNFGTIAALSAGGSGNDGIDFQSGDSGTVNNMTGGTITGARHGITGDLAQTINNDGAITGQAGAGINLDTTTGTTVINNTANGTITGNAVTSDGDAIDVDYLVDVHNAGVIKAVGTFAGETNEALAIGGGSVVNAAGGVITSAQRAITVDDSNLGNAFGAVSIDNSGTITGQNGEAIRITSILANTLTNRASGVINGSVTMGAGDDTLNLFAGSAIVGAIDGGAGADTLNLMGPGTASFTGAAHVETLAVQSGVWNLSGAQTYATATSVASGASLGVNGTLGTGTLNFANGSFYRVSVNATAVAGTIAATSAVTLNGGTVAVTATSGIFANVTHYTLITGASVTGTFSNVILNQSFLHATLSYTATEVDLTLTRNMSFLQQYAVTPNQTAVARALDNSPIDSALFLGVANLTDAAARAAFDQLSGEIHASLNDTLLGNTQDMQNAVLERLVQDPPDEPAALWFHAVGDWRTLDGTGGTYGLRASNGGIVGGYDHAIGGDSRLGLSVGYSTAESNITALSSRMHANGLDVMAYGETSLGGAIHLRAGVGYTDYLGIHTLRTVTVPSNQTLTASYHADAVQGFAEASYPTMMGSFHFEPLVDVNAVGLTTGAFAETGGSAAVSGASTSQTLAFTTLGARFSTNWGAGDSQFMPRLLVGWRHAFGDVDPSVAQLFQSTGTTFTVAGTPIDSDAGVVEAGLDVMVHDDVKLSANYTGQFGPRETANGVNLTLGWNF